MQEHPSVLMRPPWDVQIDVKLRPIIRILWTRGIRTYFSCQGTPDGPKPKKAYIRFQSQLDAALFVARAGPVAWGPKTHFARWRQIPPDNRWYWEWSLSGLDVDFPHEDIPRVEQALRAHGWTVDELIDHRDSVTGGHAMPEAAPPRICKGCGGFISSRTRRDAVYCCERCRKGARRRSRKDSSPATREDGAIRPCTYR
jgi:hypothetical protein